MAKLSGNPGPRRAGRRRSNPVGPNARGDERPPSRLGRFLRLLEAPSTVAAFLLSLGVFLLGGIQAIRGPEIVVLQPREILLFRDAQSETADSLVIATELGLINTASDSYGDVPTAVTLNLASFPQVGFAYEAAIQPTYLRRGEDDRLDECPVESRCILPVGPAASPEGEQPNTRLLVIAGQRELLDVPGGSARAEWVSFALSDCDGPAQDCAQFSGFRQSVQTLRRSETLQVSVHLAFHSDGPKTVVCERRFEDAAHREAFFDFLEERGWVAFRCQ